MPRQRPPLADQELEIMRVVWDRGEVTVREVYEEFRERRPVAYTTVLTTMRILEQKGHFAVSRAARAHVYRARSTREGVLRAMVRHFVDRVFGGAAEPSCSTSSATSASAPTTCATSPAGSTGRRRTMTAELLAHNVRHAGVRGAAGGMVTVTVFDLDSDPDRELGAVDVTVGGEPVTFAGPVRSSSRLPALSIPFPQEGRFRMGRPAGWHG